MENFSPEANDEGVSGQEDRVVSAHQASGQLIADVLERKIGNVESLS